MYGPPYRQIALRAPTPPSQAACWSVSCGLLWKRIYAIFLETSKLFDRSCSGLQKVRGVHCMRAVSRPSLCARVNLRERLCLSTSLKTIGKPCSGQVIGLFVNPCVAPPEIRSPPSGFVQRLPLLFLFGFPSADIWRTGAYTRFHREQCASSTSLHGMLHPLSAGVFDQRGDHPGRVPSLITTQGVSANPVENALTRSCRGTLQTYNPSLLS